MATAAADVLAAASTAVALSAAVSTLQVKNYDYNIKTQTHVLSVVEASKADASEEEAGAAEAGSSEAWALMEAGTRRHLT
jgi:hypothetical protein